MNKENQVCTAEQGKKLKELGIEQIAVWSWCPDGEDIEDMFVAETNNDGEGGYFADDDEYSAFSVAELGVMLPDALHHIEDQYRPFIEFYPHTNCDEWKFNDPYTIYQSAKIVTEANTEAAARAAMLIYLLEKNHITASEVNERLKNA